MKSRKKKSLPNLEDVRPKNVLKKITTKDGQQYEVLDSLLIRYSQTCKTMIAHDEEANLKVSVDSECFDYCGQFLMLHRYNQPIKIQVPIKTNQDIRAVMQDGDAELVERVMDKGDQFFKKVLDQTSYLGMEDFKKRLLVGLAIKLTSHTVDELKNVYEIQEEEEIAEEDLRKDMKKKLKKISQSKNSDF